MAFRGYFALNGVEIANSSRVVAHIGADIPTNDLGLISGNQDCSIAPIAPGSLLYEAAPSSAPIAPGSLLYTPPDGTRLYGPGLGLVGDCWNTANLCFGCRESVGYDDSWPGLPAMLQDTIYRPELAPWYTTRSPESAEFAGIWVLDVKGLDVTPAERTITELAGSGAAAGPARDASRRVSFDALLLACTNAGLTYGLQWLTCQLRDTLDRSDSILRYLAAHPSGSAADPATLVREVHGVTMASAPSVSNAVNTARGEHSQATMYRVTWEMVVLHPYAYLPSIPLAVEWDTVVSEPIQWTHAADCVQPSKCDPMPVLFGTDCVPEKIEMVTSPPPSCGGCLPVCAVQTHVYEVPVFDYPMRCRETAVSLSITNHADSGGLTLQGYFRLCGTPEECDDNRWPVQITGLPPSAELVLDGISGRYWVNYSGRRRRPVGILGTPSGAPWRPPIIDRSQCWEFVVQTDGYAQFDVSMSLTDREA